MPYSTAQAAQGAGSAARLIRGPRALFPCHIAGPAWPCRCSPGGNLALHRAIAAAKPGVVIVCDAAGRDDVAYFGELMALECVCRRVAGLVLYGAVRDVAALKRIGFPVFSTALCPLPAAKTPAGSCGRPVKLQGVPVKAGDWIVADLDGVVMVSAADWPSTLSGIKQTQAREKRAKQRMRAGESLADILALNVRSAQRSAE